jgi:hypothetical protein
LVHAKKKPKDWEEFLGLNQMAGPLVSILLSRATQSIKTLHKIAKDFWLSKVILIE